MSNSAVETLIGAAVIGVAGFFFFYAYDATGSGGAATSYSVTARFQNATGISSGTDVRLSGIKIGTVSETKLDPVSYQAIVSLSLDKEVELSDDSSIKVASEGLLGGSYLSIEPGGSMDLLEEGSEIEYTQSSVDLMSLLGQAVFSMTSSDDGESDKSETP